MIVSDSLCRAQMLLINIHTGRENEYISQITKSFSPAATHSSHLAIYYPTTGHQPGPAQARPSRLNGASANDKEHHHHPRPRPMCHCSTNCSFIPWRISQIKRSRRALSGNDGTVVLRSSARGIDLHRFADCFWPPRNTGRPKRWDPFSVVFRLFSLPFSISNAHR